MHGRNFKLFQPELFEKENILDFSENYTAFTPTHSERFANFYSDLDANYDKLKYIGDKIPNSHSRTADIYQRFPNIKIIFIVRNIEDTACSWQARAENVNDRWPSTKTAEQAVQGWNECNSTIIDLYTQHPEDVHIVDYGSFFDGDPDHTEQYDSLLQFLEIDKEEIASEAFRKAREYYRDRIKTKERNLSTETKQYLMEYADMDIYNKLLDLANYQYTQPMLKAA